MTRHTFSKAPKGLRGVLALAALATPLALPTALTQTLDASITATLAAADGIGGGCAAQLSVEPSNAGLNCLDRWVTFDCRGELDGSRANAQRMFDSAQLAFATGGTIRVWVDDEQKVGNFCLATRIDPI